MIIWKSGELLRCIETSTDTSKLNFCLLLMATNPSCISQLLSIREGLEKEIEIARSRFVEGLIRFQRGEIKKSIEVIGSIKREDLKTIRIVVIVGMTSIRHFILISHASLLSLSVSGLKVKNFSRLASCIR